MRLFCKNIQILALRLVLNVDKNVTFLEVANEDLHADLKVLWHPGINDDISVKLLQSDVVGFESEDETVLCQTKMIIHAKEPGVGMSLSDHTGLCACFRVYSGLKILGVRSFIGIYLRSVPDFIKDSVYVCFVFCFSICFE